MIEQAAIFGSNTREMVLEEVAKAPQPLSAYSIARVSGSNKKSVYEECSRLEKLGIFKAVPTGKNQTGYLYSDNEEAQKLKQFFYAALKKNSKSVVEKISAALPMTDYYISLPVSLRTTFDVFYSPNYLLVFIDKDDRDSITRLGQLFDTIKERVLVKPVSLRAREFKYDKAVRASLATNEQAIADGLNYYSQIEDREIIRTLLTRAPDFDLGRVAEWLNNRGVTRLLAVLVVIKAVLGKAPDETLLDYLQRKKRAPLDGKFRSDLQSEAIPLLLPNDEAYKGEVFERTIGVVSQALKSLA